MQRKSCDFLSEDESKFISQYVIDTENEVKKTGRDFYLGTSKNSLTGRYMTHNYLYSPCGDILIPKIKNLFGDEILVQCWANIFRKGEGIKEHEHGINFVSGNIFLQGDPNHGTYYQNQKEINKVGQLTYFNSELRHHVEPNPTDNLRVTMAMDIHFLWNLKESRKEKMMQQSDRFFYITK
jgi:hypothetical protein